MASARTATSVDALVADRVRLRRTTLGLSQAKLADMIGVASQQLHKYESGGNRISASRLFELSKVLGVPVAWFFSGQEAQEPSGEAADNGAGLSASTRSDLTQTEIASLLHVYLSMPDSASRRRALDLLRLFAGQLNS
jgi:DNA-binding XRE family transcriptional regulator